MEKLFKNAKIVDIEKETVFDADILIEDSKIVSFEKNKEFSGEVIDLAGGLVLPSFVNSFSNSREAVIRHFALAEKDFQDETFSKNVTNLFVTKNLLAGAVFFNDVSVTKLPVVENLEGLDEKSLSELSMKIAKEKKRPFLKVGQDLESLGQIDREFGKSAALILEDFGFLDRDPIVVGGNCFEKDDFDILRNYDCDFVILPNEDGRNGRRQTNLVSLLAKGFNVALGSGDSAEIDFFAFMRQLIFAMRSMFENEAVLTEKDVLKIATSGAALGRENVLKTHGNATFIVVDGRESLYQNILKTLVWERSKKDVIMCVKDGEVLQKNGEIFMKNMPSYDTIIRNLKQ